MINFGVGPSKLYPSVAQHVEEAMHSGVCELSHRSSLFQEILARATEGIRAVLDIPSRYSVYYLSSATEAMERVLQGCVEKRSHHLVNGAFSQRFQKMAMELGKDASLSEVAWGTGWLGSEDLGAGDMELLAVTQNETSTGVWTPPSVIQSFREKYPQALLVLDIVSSVPQLSLKELDFDAALFSVQKGFGLPAGLGVLVVSEACLDKARWLEARGNYTGGFHSLLSLEGAARKNQTPETPNMLGIYLLGQVCQDFLHHGMDRLRTEIEARAKILYRELSRGERSQALVEREAWRSPTVLVFESDHAVRIREEMEKAGIRIGAGYGPLKERQFRVANFPAQTQQEVAELIERFQERRSEVYEGN